MWSSCENIYVGPHCHSNEIMIVIILTTQNQPVDFEIQKWSRQSRDVPFSIPPSPDLQNKDHPWWSVMVIITITHCQCLRSDMIWKSLRLSFLLTVIIETMMVAKKVYDKNILKKVSNNWLSWLGLISSLKFNLGGRHQTPPPSSHFRGIWQRFSSPSSYSTPPVSSSSPQSSSWAWWSLSGK